MPCSAIIGGTSSCCSCEQIQPDITQQIRELRTLIPKWDDSIKSFTSRLRKPHSRGGGKRVRARGHGGHQENKTLWVNTSKAHMCSATTATRTGPEWVTRFSSWDDLQFRVCIGLLSVWMSGSVMIVPFLGSSPVCLSCPISTCLFLFYLSIFYFNVFILFYYLSPKGLFVFKWETEKQRIWMGGVVRGIGMTRGRGNYNQDTLYDENPFK